jgi:predicted porin
VAFSVANTRDQTINPSLDLGVPTFLGGAATSFTAPRVKPIGAGISYEFGSFKPHLALTRVTIERGARSADLDSVDVGGTYTLGAASIGAGVTHAKLEGARWTQYSLGYIFNLSRRTKVYTNVNYQTASGTARNAVMPTLAASSDKSQLVPHIGLTHNF